MTVSNPVISDDAYFVYGLSGLLGWDFINEFFIVLDLDSQHSGNSDILNTADKEVVAFVSSDIAFYNAQKIGVHYVLDKKSSVQNILDFFLFKRDSGTYHIKRKLTQREKEVLSLMSDGATRQEMTTKLGINYKTFYSHRKNLMLKLGCVNRICLHNLFLKR